jgi:phosphoribosylaminoimidazole-succinocarboxamide synthase
VDYASGCNLLTAILDDIAKDRSEPLVQTSIDAFPLWRRGKVRDVYDLGDRLLIVATDRLSAFDVVLPTGIPGKGKVLTQLSLFWFELLRDVVENHVITADVASYPAALLPFRSQLEHRSMIVAKTEPFPIECVVRGYLAGSGWKDYQGSRVVCGVALPEGLRESEKLGEAIFTPATKAESGHDENVSMEEAARRIGVETVKGLREVSLSLFRRASAHAGDRGIILADTKFEFGLRQGRLIWIDEAVTPDSSRFWPKAGYAAGRSQPSFDKQYVRDYLETLAWDKTPPGPTLPAEVVERTRDKYFEAFRRLTGPAVDPNAAPGGER